jgi:hypothetical protein
MCFRAGPPSSRSGGPARITSFEWSGLKVHLLYGILLAGRWRYAGLPVSGSQDRLLLVIWNSFWPIGSCDR